MDIISYSKAMAAKKNIQKFQKRIGEGDANKAGAKDIKDIHANVKARLDSMEAKRYEMTIAEKVIAIETDFAKGLSSKLKQEAGVIELAMTNVGGAKQNVIVSMSGSNTKDGNVVKASQETSDGPAWKAFNGTTTDWTDRWFIPNATGADYIQYKFAENKIISSYSIAPVVGDGGLGPKRAPKNFNLSGSNDGTNWTLLDLRSEVTSWTEGTELSFEVTSANSFLYYRLTVTATNGNAALEIGDIKMYQSALSREENGYWESSEYDLGEDFVDYVNVAVTGDDLNSSTLKILTKGTHDTEFIGQIGGSIQSKISKKIKLRLELTSATLNPKIKSIKIQFKTRTILNRISDVEKHTHINIMKHNLRVSALLNQKRLKMKDMIVDDLKDSSGIDSTKSINITHDPIASKITQVDTKLASSIVTIKEDVSEMPTMCFVGCVVNDSSEVTKEVYVKTGIITGLVVKANTLQLKNIEGSTTEFISTGSWESEVLDFGQNIKSIKNIVPGITVPTGTSLKLFFATSADGIFFDSYTGLESFTVSTKRYLKFKAILTSKAEVQAQRVLIDFLAGDASKFAANEFVTFDGAVKLNKTGTTAMTKDTSFTEEGTLLRAPINRLRYKKIDKIEVK